MAVFTLPSEMLPLYKKNITFIEEHSVDPDKRRYATKHEAYRHYIDLDQWGTLPFTDLKKSFGEVIADHASFFLIMAKDTIEMNVKINNDSLTLSYGKEIQNLRKKDFLSFFYNQVMTKYYEDEWIIDEDSLNLILKGVKAKLYVKDNFSEHGILPYYLSTHLTRLTDAFADGNVYKILQLSAEMGHYIGDAHVPLHTTKNYNGQLTDQVGIHAFWESRLPELFANEEYDFFVGKAEFIEKPQEYFWKMILESHGLLNEVLDKEKMLSKNFPTDQQYCFDERLGLTVRTQCKSYADAYHKSMNNMVENRMARAIQAIGSVWYTAWVNAGQPNIRSFKNNQTDIENIEAIKVNPKVKTREHEN